MNKQFLSIKDAIDKTGMSDATVRRLCRKGIKGKDYKHDMEGKLFVLDSFLFNSYPPQTKADHMHMKLDYEAYKSMLADIEHFKEAVRQHPIEMLSEKDKRIEDLKKELKIKDDTISYLSSTLQGLNKNIGLLSERAREQNIIIQSLQEKMTNSSFTRQPVQLKQKQSAAKVLLIDKLLIGVAVLASVALLSFVGMMIWAYINR